MILSAPQVILTDTSSEQIVLYVVSRVVASILSRDRSKSAAPSPPGTPARPIHPNATQFSVFAAVAWGAVMWLFENHAELIQPGMWASMVYLYKVRCSRLSLIGFVLLIECGFLFCALQVSYTDFLFLVDSSTHFVHKAHYSGFHPRIGDQ